MRFFFCFFLSFFFFFPFIFFFFLPLFFVLLGMKVEVVLVEVEVEDGGTKLVMEGVRALCLRFFFFGGIPSPYGEKGKGKNHQLFWRDVGHLGNWGLPGTSFSIGRFGEVERGMKIDRSREPRQVIRLWCFRGLVWNLGEVWGFTVGTLCSNSGTWRCWKWRNQLVKTHSRVL